MSKHFKRVFAAGLLASCSATAAVAQNYEYSPIYQPNLAQIGITSTLHSDFKAYISTSTAAQSVGIAILDGRADPNHVDLRGRLGVYRVYSGTYRRYSQHGTHVAGIAGASQNDVGIVGVAPNTRLYSIPVFDDRGWVASDLGRLALNKAVSLKASVANMSYGPTATGDVFLNGELNIFDDYKNSLVLVRAAGNSGVNARNEYYTGDASMSLAHLLIVGSVDSNNQISSFSNRPGEACIAISTTCASDDMIKEFFIVAPGRSIASDLPNNSYAYMSGTSMAAPHVSGAAALVFQNAYAGNTLLTPADVAGILKRSATDLGDAGVDSVYGWGLLNVAAALAPVGSTTIATSGSVDGSTTTLTQSSVSTSSAVGQSGAFEKLLGGMVVFDDYGRGYVMQNVNLAGPRSTLADDAVSSLNASLLGEEEVQETDAGRLSMYQISGATSGFSGFSFATDGYAVSSGVGNAPAYFTQTAGGGDPAPSLRLGRQFFTGAGDIGQDFTSGFFSSADISLTPALTVSAFYARGSDQVFNEQSDWTDSITQDPDVKDLLTVGTSLALGEAGTIGLSLGLLREEESMLGVESAGAFSLCDSAYTQMMSLSYSRKIGQRMAFDAFAQLGVTSTSGTEDSVFSSVSDVWSSKMGLSLASTSVLQERDRLQLSLVSPWRVFEGDVEAQVAVGREFDGTVNYDTRRVSLAGGDLPIDVGLSYTATAGNLSYGGSLWLRDGNVETVSVDEAVIATGLSWHF